MSGYHASSVSYWWLPGVYNSHLCLMLCLVEKAVLRGNGHVLFHLEHRVLIFTWDGWDINGDQLSSLRLQWTRSRSTLLFTRQISMVTATYVLELDKPCGSHVNEYTCGFLCELFTHGNEAAIWPSVYFTMLRKCMAMFWPFGSNVQEHVWKTACAKNSVQPFWIVLLTVTRQLLGPACTEPTMSHSYANRLHVVPCLRWKGRG